MAKWHNPVLLWSSAMSLGTKSLTSHSPAPGMQSGCHESSTFGTAREDDVVDDDHSTLLCIPSGSLDHPVRESCLDLSQAVNPYPTPGTIFRETDWVFTLKTVSCDLLCHFGPPKEPVFSVFFSSF